MSNDCTEVAIVETGGRIITTLVWAVVVLWLAYIFAGPIAQVAESYLPAAPQTQENLNA